MKTIEKMNYEEKELNAPNGWAVLFITIILYIAAIFGVIYCSAHTNEYSFGVYDIEMIICIIWLCIGWFPLIGLRIIKPNEALVLTLFGKYIGTIKHEGFFFVNIFSVPVTTKSQSGGKPGMPAPQGFPQGDDPRQPQAEDKRPDGQSHRGGNCSHLARHKYREGTVQR